jgi:carbon-monoxide dehydrogenase small subunit
MRDMSTHTVEIHVNGRLRQAKVFGSTTLLELLREQWGLTGTKDGCGEGDCGACTVIMDGQPIKSCLVLAVQAQGSQVTTVEGLAGDDGSLHPLQQAFIDVGAVQCGYCIPGMLLAGKALLDANPRPSRSEIKIALSGNLCRCTGYSKIIEAVKQGAEQMQEEGA